MPFSTPYKITLLKLLKRNKHHKPAQLFSLSTLLHGASTMFIKLSKKIVPSFPLNILTT